LLDAAIGAGVLARRSQPVSSTWRHHPPFKCHKQVSGVNHSALTQDAGVFAHGLTAADGACP
jgi:hypothetical protein